jgi:hypothetical protein
MKEIPHQAILNREEAKSVADKYFSKQTEMLRDLANYGSNLTVRALESSPKQIAEVVICGVLLKQIVAMVDAAEVLLSAGCGHASYLPARTAFEASIYIDWIFDSDSERKATRFIVRNFRDEKLWASRVIPGTTEEIFFTKIAKILGLDIYTSQRNLAAEAETHLEEVKRILAQPRLAQIDQEFTVARGSKKFDPEWYELDGLKSIRQVAEKVGRIPEYEFFYSKGSQVIHTGTYKDHGLFVDGQFIFKPIRHLADVNLLLKFIVSICLQAYRRIVERYRPGEILAFTKKYLEDWQDPFLNAMPLKYNF